MLAIAGLMILPAASSAVAGRGWASPSTQLLLQRGAIDSLPWYSGGGLGRGLLDGAPSRSHPPPYPPPEYRRRGNNVRSIRNSSAQGEAPAEPPQALLWHGRLARGAGIPAHPKRSAPRVWEMNSALLPTDSAMYGRCRGVPRPWARRPCHVRDSDLFCNTSDPRSPRLRGGSLALPLARTCDCLIAPAPPADRAALVQLGQALFYDNTLSNPPGQSCASCHSQAVGWTSPNSKVNEKSGIMEGAIKGRFGHRRPPTIGYAQFMTGGPPVFVTDQAAYAGGFFYDGRAATLAAQIPGPITDPNEMNNTPADIVTAVIDGRSAGLFEKAFGVKASTLNIDEAFNDIVSALVSFETTANFAPFNSKYDDYVAGKATLTGPELAGLQLFTGSKTGRPGGPAVKSARCATCHTVEAAGGHAHDLFSSSTFHNIGIPKNPANPYYAQTDAAADPQGYNPLGAAFIDYGLGNILYPQNGLPAGNSGNGADARGDYLRINGLFKTPTLRNVDSRPSPDFVKCYGHNGYFKSLAQVVHFYNTRNLTTSPGEVINFTAADPYAHLRGKPLWPPPEISDPHTLENPTGARGMIGNLGLSPTDEANLLAFLQTLSDSQSKTP